MVNLQIRKFQTEDSKEIIELWNNEMTQYGYKEFNEESFCRIFTDSPYFNESFTAVLENNSKIYGFACGCVGNDLPHGHKSGFVTCVVLNSSVNTYEKFSELIAEIEKAFAENGKKTSEVLFFNPMMLPWYIPNTHHHEHNNAPGVPMDTPMFTWYRSSGYETYAVECAMYLDLKNGFIIPENILKKEKKSVEKGYYIELMSMDKHKNIEGMLKSLQNPLWEKKIMQALKQRKPVLAAVKDGEAVGFAGPVIRTPNGRGYFSGIGVSPKHQGNGMGTVLFFKLCEAFANIGTDYMSLYTGEENPAKEIYEQAGFKTVRKFAVMKKELKL